MDSEVHIVFKKKGESVLEDDFCVIGILFKSDDENSDDHERKLMTSFHPEAANQDISVNIGEIMQNTLLKSMEFLHYKGSLTTPPCTESVNWFVHSKVFKLKRDDLAPFFEKWSGEEYSPQRRGNSRPCCPLNGRSIYKIKAQNFD